MNWSVVGSIVGALGVGLLVTQYVLGGQARREVRSAVLRQLAEVEIARWAGPPGEVDLLGFRETVRELETAALIARIPRRAVVHYLVCAYASRWASEEFYERHGDEEVGGILPTDIYNVVRDAAETVSRLAWSPWFSRIGLRRRIKKQRESVLKWDKDDREFFDRAQKAIGPQ